MKEREIFDAALAIADPDECDAFLSQACNGDPGLKEHVRGLLEMERKLGSFLEAPGSPPTMTIDSPPLTEAVGTLIGPYKLLEQIGEGGMGVVYMAEQTRPMRRKVALKIIKPGMDTKQVIARFEAERQALALMDHPNIARVLDAGATDGGRPYFVMELVRGIPITTYCDQAHLSIDDRLELFVLVCQAVQHAHQKGIIHRDLKPTNVLITLHDGVPVPKIIDFGIAKAMGQQLTEKTLFTGFAQLVGTPLYMSPEQAELSGLDMDTRSDIYSLGVLLYELLTGTTPFDQETFRKAAFDELRRIIREQEPPKPSTRLSTLGVTLTTVSANRGADARKLSHAMRGELDWIVMKCLEKDRTRRYETASGLASDVRRYLDDESVQACPPTARYRFSKFARRNRAIFTTAGLLALTLLAGAAASAWQAVRATRAEHRMANALADAQDQRREAQRKAAEAAAVAGFLVRDLVAQASPQRSQGRELTVLQAMARAEKALDDRFADQPLVEAAIRQAVAQSYKEMTRYREGERHARRALALRLEHLGPDHPETLDSVFLLAETTHLLQKNDEAHDLCQRAIEGRRRVLGPDHGETIYSRIVLGHILRGLGEFEASREMQESTYELARRVLGPTHKYTLEAMIGLGLVHMMRQEPVKAQKLFEAVLAVRRQAARPDPFALQWTLWNVGKALGAQGKYAEAEPVFEEAVEIGAASLGLDHGSTELALQGMIRCLGRQGKGEALRALHERWLRRLEGSDAPPGGGSAPRLTGGRLGEMISDLVWFELDVSSLLVDREACVRAAKRAAELYPDAFARQVLSLAYCHTGRTDEAIAAAAGDSRVLNKIAWILATHGEPELRDAAQAVALARKAVELTPQSPTYQRTLGVARYRSGDWQAAIEALTKAEELAPDKALALNGFFLAMAHWQLGHAEQARTWYDRAVTCMERHDSTVDELIRFRAEAAALLAVDSRPTGTTVVRPKAEAQPK